MKLYCLRIMVQLLELLMIAIVTSDVVVSAQSVLPWLSRFSPVMTIATRVSAMQWSPYFAGGVLVALLSMIFPRLFCGWICPLGTCIDITDRLTLAGTRQQFIPSSWKIAFTVFLWLIIASALHYDLAGFVDPLTVIGNTAMAINSIVTDSAESAFASGYHYHSRAMVGIFLAILVLTVFGRRTWCRALCPLGGLLGFLTPVSLYRRTVADGCIKCGRCKKECKMNAVAECFEATIHQSCISCRTCMKACSKNITTIE